MKNAEQPAYPTKKGEHDCQFRSVDVHGLTKREYFTAMAMQGMSNQLITFIMESPDQEVNQMVCKAISLASIQIADDLLSRLEP